MSSRDAKTNKHIEAHREIPFIDCEKSLSPLRPIRCFPLSMFGPRQLFRHRRIFWSAQCAAKSDLHPKVAETDNGSYFVVWHPEKKIPYECTRPLPVSNEAGDNAASHLKMDSKEVYGVFKPKAPEVIREELMETTYTTKHRWFPRARDKKAKKTPPDRPYL